MNPAGIVCHCRVGYIADMPTEQEYSVTDDSGFLALVDPYCYKSFVSAQCSLDQILQHFTLEMRHNRLVIWGTGRGDIWTVDLRFQRSASTGFCEFSTTIRASDAHLLLTNYEALTMAAQFEDVILPESHDTNRLIPVRSGLYNCRVIQRFDPEPYNPTLRDDMADFIIELLPLEPDEKLLRMDTIPWFNL